MNITSGVATVCNTPSGVAGNTALQCQQGTGWASWPAGVNPVPAGTVIQGVVNYASSNTHMYIMDPFYPFASVWVYGASCVGFVDGVANGMLVQLTLPVTGNMLISGPTYDNPSGAGMIGLGGANDQSSYSGMPDNQWVLSLNMKLGVCSTSTPPVCYAAGNASNPALCPGMTLLSHALSTPYSPTGGLYQCGPQMVTTQTLVSTTLPVNTNTPPPSPRLSFALPPSIALPPRCITVEQYLCQYTNDAQTVNNNTAPNGLTPGGSICGVWFFGTGTGNAYIQDPFYPYASIWLTTGSQTYNQDILSNKISPTGLPAVSTNSDGSSDKVTIGTDPGYTTGDYVMYTYTVRLSR